VEEGHGTVLAHQRLLAKAFRQVMEAGAWIVTKGRLGHSSFECKHRTSLKNEGCN
jgi:hypothetical protein